MSTSNNRVCKCSCARFQLAYESAGRPSTASTALRALNVYCGQADGNDGGEQSVLWVSELCDKVGKVLDMRQAVLGLDAHGKIDPACDTREGHCSGGTVHEPAD
jgi:hypothetical protein